MSIRLFRGIAILFLLYTAAELTAPQYCAEALSLAQNSERSVLSNDVDLTGVSGGSHSEKEEPSKRRSSGDEDCFCCCAHVLPGTVMALDALPEPKTTLVEVNKIGLPSPPLQSPYHPPKTI